MARLVYCSSRFARVDHMRTVDITSAWTLRRAGSRADVSCETAVLLDPSDIAYHGVRVTLNGEPVYERLFARRADAERESAETWRDLLARGWRDDLDWMPSTAAAPLRCT